MIVECPKCGAKNRVPEHKEWGGDFRCGRCHARLSEILKNQTDFISKRRSFLQDHVKDNKRRLKSLRESWLQPPIIHPILLAVFPILALYSQNMHEVIFSETITMLVLSICSTLLLVLVLGLIFKNVKKVGIIVSIFLILFFSYGHIVSAMEDKGIFYSSTLISVLWILFFSVSIYLVIRMHKDLRSTTIILNIAALCLVIIPSISISMYELNRPSFTQTNESQVTTSDSIIIDNNFPNIYYIILDGYASSNVLYNYFGFDNTEFIHYLSDKGFFIALESKSNYNITTHSIPSSLNFEYLNYLENQFEEDTTDVRPYWQMVQNHKVWQYLEQKGYTYIHIASYWKLTGLNEFADINLYPFPGTLNEFEMLLLNTTWFRALGVSNEALFSVPIDERQRQWTCAVEQFENIIKTVEMEDVKRPIFVFAHVVIPHVPFVFEQDGKFLAIEAEAERTRNENYLNQLAFCNGKIMELVDTIISESDDNTIVILQGDHGAKEWSFADWSNLSIENQIEMSYSILNAYYFPRGEDELLYDSITPVNTFRLVFNEYFGENYELLPDESFFSDLEHPYRFQNVADLIKQ